MTKIMTKTERTEKSVTPKKKAKHKKKKVEAPAVELSSCINVAAIGDDRLHIEVDEVMMDHFGLDMGLTIHTRFRQFAINSERVFIPTDDGEGAITILQWDMDGRR